MWGQRDVSVDFFGLPLGATNTPSSGWGMTSSPGGFSLPSPFPHGGGHAQQPSQHHHQQQQPLATPPSPLFSPALFGGAPPVPSPSPFSTSWETQAQAQAQQPHQDSPSPTSGGPHQWMMSYWQQHAHAASTATTHTPQPLQPLSDPEMSMVSESTSSATASPSVGVLRSAARPRKSRTSRVCFHCKMAHTSCGHQRPCYRCVKRGLTCVDAPQQGRKRNVEEALGMELLLEEHQDSKKKLFTGTRVKAACLHCKRAHAPCSEGTPCQRCISKGLECVPAPTKRRGKKARSQQPRDSPSPAVAQQEHLISPLAFPRSDSFGGVLPDPQHLLPVKNSAWGTTIFKNEYDHQLALEVQRMTASVLASSGSSPPALPPHSSFVPLEQQSLPHGPSSSSSSTLSPSDDSSSAHNSCAHSHSELEHCSDCDPGAEAGIVMSDVEEDEDGETQSPLAARNKPSRTHPQKTVPVSKKLRVYAPKVLTYPRLVRRNAESQAPEFANSSEPRRVYTGEQLDRMQQFFSEYLGEYEHVSELDPVDPLCCARLPENFSTMFEEFVICISELIQIKSLLRRGLEDPSKQILAEGLFALARSKVRSVLPHCDLSPFVPFEIVSNLAQQSMSSMDSKMAAAAYQSAGIPMALFNCELGIVHYNQAFSTLFEVDEQNCRCIVSFKELIHPDDFHLVMEQCFSKGMTEGLPGHITMTANFCSLKSFNVIHAHANLTVHKAQDTMFEEFVQFFPMGEDITKRQMRTANSHA